MTKSFSASALDRIRALLLWIPGCQSMRLLLSRTETEISGRFFARADRLRSEGSAPMESDSDEFILIAFMFYHFSHR